MAYNSRIIREVMNVMRDESIVGMRLIPDCNDLRHLTAIILGPVSSPYNGAIFHVDITLPDGYPFVPPKMRFTTKVWHPNISSQTGAICLDHNWSPVLNLYTTMLTLQALLSTPQPDDPQDAVVAKQYLSDHAAYVATARSWTKDFANMKVQKLVEMGSPEVMVKKTMEPVGGNETMALERLC